MYKFIEYIKRSSKYHNSHYFSKRLYFASVPNMLHRSIKHSQYDQEKSINQQIHILIFLWTKEKTPEKDIILNLCKPFFDEIILLEIPIGNQRVHYSRIKRLYKTYNYILDKDVTDIIVFSFKKHYSILLSLAHEKNIKTILGEEGTASYEFLPEKKGYHYCNINNNKKSFLKYILYYINFILVSINKKYKVFLKPHRKFDELRLDYPKILENYFDANKVILFPFKISKEKEKEINKIIFANGYNRNTIIFASQIIWGIDFSKIIPIIANILKKYTSKDNNNEKIIFKPHPKEDISYIKKYIDEYSDIFILEDNISCPLEEFIYVTKPKMVISVGSSSLIYGHQVSPETHFVSIAQDTMIQVKKYHLNTERSDQFFNGIIPILKLFPHIEFSNNS